MLNNSDTLQNTNNLYFSQKNKELYDTNNNYNYFSNDNKNFNITRNNLQRTYEMQNVPNLILSGKIHNKDNNINESSSQNELNNQNKTFSNKYYSLNQNNSLLNEQQSESQIMKNNNANINTSDINNNGNMAKMSISELNDDNYNNNNKNMRNIYINEDNLEKKYFSENNYEKNNYPRIDIEDNNDIVLKNKDNNDYNNIIDNDNYNYNDEEYNEEENENIEENENEENNDNNEENKKNKELEEFLNYNDNKDKISQKENNYILFGTNNSTSKNLNNDIINYNSISQSNNKNENFSKNADNKRNFFSKIIDIEILIDTNEIYSKPWSQIINDIYIHLEKNNDSIQLISLGAQHTLCLSNQGKLFSFGWNNYSQCGKKQEKNRTEKNIKMEIDKIEEINEINIEQKVCDISAGEDHSLIVCDTGRLYGFGINNNGQLCYDPKKHKIISKPSLIKSFRRNFMMNVQCTNNISFILNDKKEAFICPWEDQNKKINYIPIKLYFPLKAKISMISCGDNFSIFLSKNGNIYSMGSNNKYGQLGHGNTNICLSPKMILFFKNKKIKITQISCGYSHTLALGDKGEVFSWGLGSEGQLGQNLDVEVNYNPEPIDFFIKNNILIYQVSAGYHNSYFLTEDNEVYMCGSNGINYIKEFVPKKIEVKNKYKDMENYPVWICRILNCWNRSMSVFYTIFLDCNFIDKDDERVHNVLDMISKRWLNQSYSADIMKGFDNINYD